MSRAQIPTAEQLSAWYRDEYWKHHGAEQVSRGRDDVYRHAFAVLRSRLPHPETLVDVGCGAGGLLALCRMHGWREIGFDPCVPAVEHARSLGLDARAIPWPPCPLPDGEAGAVTFINALDHMPDPFAALREARRVLRPGGLLYVRVPNAPLQVTLTRLLSPFGLGDLPVFHLLGRRALLHHLPRLGFRVVALATAPPSSGHAGFGGWRGSLITAATRVTQRLVVASHLAGTALDLSIEAIASRSTAPAEEPAACPDARRST